jgi:hypothetical protein
MALIQMRRGTAAAWTSTNPVLAAAEWGVETDTGFAKIGNGTSVWATLPYVTANLAAAIHAAPIKATPVSADELGLWDSVTAALRRLSWANLLAMLDARYATTSSLIVSNDPTLDIVAGAKYNYVEDNALSAAVVITATDGVAGGQLWVGLTGTASRAITWTGADFESGAQTLPASTTGTQRTDAGFTWNSGTSRWRLMFLSSA